MSIFRQVMAIALSGTLIGFVGAFFLNAMWFADTARVALIAFADAHSFPAWLAAVIACLAGASLAAWLANRIAPDSPQVSVSQYRRTPEGPISDVGGFSANFVGASLAVGAGFALGPERPAIQMGAIVGRAVSRRFALAQSDYETFVAAAGGAGVATMFNSPLGCAAYTVEAVLKRVDFQIAAITLGMGGISVAVTRLLTGRDVNFVIGTLTGIDLLHLLLCFFLGCLIAVFANFHVHLIMVFARFTQTATPRPMVRAAFIGGLIGLLAWYAPGLVGAGEKMTQVVLDGRLALLTMVGIFVVRFFLGPLSLSAGTPGGYFTPVLLLGASFGGVFGTLVNYGIPGSDVSPTTFALIGMAVALATVANAPFTGILLVIETTGAFSLSLPMTIAVLGSVVVGRILQMPTLTHGLEIALKQPDKKPDQPPDRHSVTNEPA